MFFPGTLLRKHVLYHIIGWTVFIVYEVSFVTIIRGTQPSIWASYLIPYVFNIGLFYCHALFTLEVSLHRSKPSPIELIFLVVTEIVVYLLLMGVKDVESEGAALFLHLYPSKLSFIQQLWRGIYFLIFSTGFWLIQRSFEKERMLKEAETRELLRQKEKQELEIKLISSQNAFLQAQINPHLLFNALNFIHSEVQRLSPLASEAIITLSDMMRYSLAQNSATGKTPLTEEIEQIENLIRLNQFRFDNKLNIQFEIKGDLEHVSIVPLILLPFVENIFKYGELNNPAHPARITIEIQENTLVFYCTNLKRKTVNFPSAGIGINNVKTRLNNHYPERFTFKIENTDSFFSVYLNIEVS